MVSGNLLGKLNVQMQAWLRLPPGIDGLKAEAYLKRAEVQLEQIQRRIELEDRQQTAAEAKAELLRVQAESRLMVQEKRARLYDLEIVQAELEVERQRQRLEAGEGQKALPPGSEEPIRGVLDFRASPYGISGGTEESRGECVAWLDGLQGGKVILLLGRRGSGKTAFTCKLGSTSSPSIRCRSGSLACRKRLQRTCHAGSALQPSRSRWTWWPS